MVAGRGGALVRRTAATALGVYGRAVLTVAEIVAPTGANAPRPLGGRAAPADVRSADPRSVDARTADLADMRRLALEATIAAVADPSRPAAERLAERVHGLSEWASGRLLDDTDRMRQAAVAVVAAGSGDGRVLQRRQFDPALRRQFPWLDDPTAARLYDHAVLVAHRIRQEPPPVTETAAAPATGRLGSLVSRLRSR